MTSANPELTALGTVAIVLLALTTARGPWGLFVVFVLVVAIVSIALTHYQTIDAYLFKKG